MMQLLRIEKALRALTHPVWRAALVRGVLASTEHRRALSPLAVRTVFDIGANRGQFVLLCRVLFPRAHIHAFEPLAAPAQTLRRLFADDALVSVHRVAIDPAVGRQVMHVSGRDDSSSLLRIGAGQVRHFPGTDAVATEEVETRRLSDCVALADASAPALLKIDVQGNEIRTIDACSELLATVEFVYVEASFEQLYVGQPLASEVVCRLARDGFQLRSVENVWHGPSGWAVQADLLFRRESPGGPGTSGTGAP